MLFDLVIVGGGIVGLSCAYYAKKKFKSMKIMLLEKEKCLCKHQSGNNSGVIHSGIYYKPGSFKATMTTIGYKKLLEFLKENSIDFKIVGKLLVAKNDSEVATLEILYERGKSNGLKDLRFLRGKEVNKVEPYLQAKVALVVPQTAITDFKKVGEALAYHFINAGGDIRLNTKLLDFDRKYSGVEIVTSKGRFFTRRLLICAGTQADRFGKELSRNIKIIPFKGVFLYLKSNFASKINHLVYPTPNLALPFLGVHFTKGLNGTVKVGPNALLSFKREKDQDYLQTFLDLLDIIFFQGIYKFVSSNAKLAIKELLKTVSINHFLREAKVFFPDISKVDVIGKDYGIRAQACFKDGKLVDDFLYVYSNGICNVVNAPSPAATASLSLAQKIVDIVMEGNDE